MLRTIGLIVAALFEFVLLLLRALITEEFVTEPTGTLVAYYWLVDPLCLLMISCIFGICLWKILLGLLALVLLFIFTLALLDPD